MYTRKVLHQERRRGKSNSNLISIEFEPAASASLYLTPEKIIKRQRPINTSESFRYYPKRTRRAQKEPKREIQIQRQSIPSFKVFRPTVEEFKDFHDYLKKISPEAREFGACKVIPPMEFAPEFHPPGERFRCKRQRIVDYYETKNAVQISSLSRKGYTTFHEFKKQAKEMTLDNSSPETVEEAEAAFWDYIRCDKKKYKALYASDLDISAFPQIEEEESEWNLRRIPTLEKGLLRYTSMVLPGISSSYSYIGSQNSAFCWHIEDDFLYSINYLHFGEPKFWYAIPASDQYKFERLYEELFSDIAEMHGLRKRTSMIDPVLLLERNISISKMIQRQGEFIITFPKAYHAGFNVGFNFAEAVNFADDDWLVSGLISSILNKEKRRVPAIPWAEIVYKSTNECFWIGLYKYFALQNLLKGEITARSTFDKVFPNAKCIVRDEWFDPHIAYCDDCKEFLYLSIVKVMDTTCKSSVRKKKIEGARRKSKIREIQNENKYKFFCLSCASFKPELMNMNVICYEHFTDSEIRVRMKTSKTFREISESVGIL